MIRVTNQLSSNITVMTLIQAGRNRQITKEVNMVGSLLYGLCRTGDLADVVRPEEAQDTTFVRVMSMAEDANQQQKKGEGKPTKGRSDDSDWRKLGARCRCSASVLTRNAQSDWSIIACAASAEL
jgi:hypothetical protein